jgi:hypothetical protein
MRSRICVDEDAAIAAVAAGERVVLILPPGSPGPDRPHSGRLAFLVGDAGDPAVVEAAEAMAADLWPGAH